MRWFALMWAAWRLSEKISSSMHVNVLAFYYLTLFFVNLTLCLFMLAAQFEWDSPLLLTLLPALPSPAPHPLPRPSCSLSLVFVGCCLLLFVVLVLVVVVVVACAHHNISLAQKNAVLTTFAADSLEAVGEDFEIEAEPTAPGRRTL